MNIFNYLIDIDVLKKCQYINDDMAFQYSEHPYTPQTKSKAGAMPQGRVKSKSCSHRLCGTEKK